jgi:uncharacterized protein DUF559
MPAPPEPPLPADPGLCFRMRNKVQSRPERRVTQLAADEWAVLSLDELRGCGLTRRQVGIRVQTGWLHPIYHGVYAVGHKRLFLQGRLLAAVKSVGRDAVLSHFAAAALWGFVDWDGRHPEVSIPRAGINREGIRVRCSSVLKRHDVMCHEGIPVTSPARTLVDLAAVVGEKMLRTAVRRALGLHRISIRQLVAARRRRGPRRGSAKLDQVLRSAAPTRSELEDVVLDLIVDGGFARPDVNRPLLRAGRRVIPDFRWPAQRLVIEADGAAWHDNPIARKDDAERQALLEASGDRLIRVTWDQAVARPVQTLARIRAAGAPLSCRAGVAARATAVRPARPR